MCHFLHLNIFNYNVIFFHIDWHFTTNTNKTYVNFWKKVSINSDL